MSNSVLWVSSSVCSDTLTSVLIVCSDSHDDCTVCATKFVHLVLLSVVSFIIDSDCKLIVNLNPVN